VADRLIGARNAVFLGGILIIIGQFTLVLPSIHTFFLGLLLVVMGTGLLKPNISVMVGKLYPEGGVKQDSGFTIFYMGINVGAASVCFGRVPGREYQLAFGFRWRQG
jgi:POT family proton-dependent oligopeptide transporter